MQVLLFATPTLAAVFSFAAYGSAAPNEFTAPHIFSAIAYFSIMRFPLVSAGLYQPPMAASSPVAMMCRSPLHLQTKTPMEPACACRCFCHLHWCSWAMPWCLCGGSISTWPWRSATRTQCVPSLACQSGMVAAQVACCLCPFPAHRLTYPFCVACAQVERLEMPGAEIDDGDFFWAEPAKPKVHMQDLPPAKATSFILCMCCGTGRPRAVHMLSAPAHARRTPRQRRRPPRRHGAQTASSAKPRARDQPTASCRWWWSTRRRL